MTGIMGDVTNAEPITPRSPLVSLGYEGRNVDEMIHQLVGAGVSVLVDVRLTPLSRKPGLSKRRLASALADSGIDYVHLRELGNPKDNRDLYRAGDPASRNRFLQLLDTTEAAVALRHIAELMEGGVVALLCFENDHRTCHRQLVGDALVRNIPDLEFVHL